MIVSKTMARLFWPGDDAVGRFVHAGDDPEWVNRQIVGVVVDARINSIHEPPEAYFYVPHAQSDRGMKLLAETVGDPLGLAGQVRAEVAALDSKVPVLAFSTLGLVTRASAYEIQTSAVVVGVLGAIGLALASFGLYGIITYAVVRRTREIGIRMALGAHRREVVGMVLWQGVCLAVVGIAIGLAGSLAAARLLENALYGVSPRDPATFASVAALMTAVAAAASYLPARRATKVDLITALRCE